MVGKNIQAARKSRKLTQEQLAELLEISKVHVSNLERGKRGLDSFDLIAAIAEKLDISPQVLLNVEDLDQKRVVLSLELAKALNDPKFQEALSYIFKYHL